MMKKFNILDNISEEVKWEASAQEQEDFLDSNIYKDLTNYFNYVLSSELMDSIERSGEGLTKTQGRCQVLRDILPTFITQIKGDLNNG